MIFGIKQFKTGRDARSLRLLGADADSATSEEAQTLSASYRAFVRAAWHVLDPAPLLLAYDTEAMIAALEAWALGQIPRLMVHIRPRRGKTRIGSVLLNGWIWTWRPDARVLWSSYGDERRTEDARLTRQLILSLWYQERWSRPMATDQSEKHRFALASGGYRYTAIWGSGATGDGGDYLGADDPQCAADMGSPTELASDHAWHYSTWERRRNMPEETRPMLVIDQRLGPLDLPNRLRVDAPHLWEVVAIQTRKTIVDMLPYYRQRADGGVDTIYLPRVTPKVAAIIPEDTRAPGQLLDGVSEVEFAALETGQPVVAQTQEQQSPPLRIVGMVQIHRFGEGNCGSFAAVMGKETLREAVSVAIRNGWQVWLGLDHGLSARREVCHVLLVNEHARKIWVVGTYTNASRTGVEEDAEGIRSKLAEIGIEPWHVYRAYGDVGNTGKGDVAPTSVNERLGEILGISITLPDKSQGSITRGVDFLNQLCASALMVDEGCRALIACLQNWSGGETWKDGVDAIRYPAAEVARIWYSAPSQMLTG